MQDQGFGEKELGWRLVDVGKELVAVAEEPLSGFEGQSSKQKISRNKDRETIMHTCSAMMPVMSFSGLL